MMKTKLLGAAAVLLLSAGVAGAVPAVSRTDLNVRSGPGTGFGVVGVLQSGEPVDVVGCGGSWCQVEFGGGSGYASRSYLQIASVPSAGVVVQAPAYDPFDDDFAYGYTYGPTVGIYAGPRYRRGGFRHGWQRPGGWHRPDRNAGTWQGRSGQGRNWQGGDRGPRIGAGMGRGGPQPGTVNSPRVSAPAGMPQAGAPTSAGAAKGVGGGGR